MRTCKKCFEMLYVSPNGNVRMCPWNARIVGNLKKNTLEEIWHGEALEDLRREFIKGNLVDCNEPVCPDCINRFSEDDIQGNANHLYESTSMETTEEEMNNLYNNLPRLPLALSLAYDERCNHACPSCRSCIMKVSDEYKKDLEIITNNIEPYLTETVAIATNGLGDLFVCSELLEMISRFRPQKDSFKMHIETNGVLFKANWDKIKHLGDYELTVAVTPNSFDRETYKYLAGVDDLERFEESMRFITDLKHDGKVDRIRMIMVVQDSNFRQIPEFVKKSIEVYDADEVVLRPIFQWFGLSEDERLFKNVLNPCHPYHKEYLEILKDPILKHPRVFNWGFKEQQEAVEFPTLEMARKYNEMINGTNALQCCLDSCQGELERVRNELNHIYNTKSWKFTECFRRLLR